MAKRDESATQRHNNGRTPSLAKVDASVREKHKRTRRFPQPQRVLEFLDVLAVMLADAVEDTSDQENIDEQPTRT